MTHPLSHPKRQPDPKRKKEAGAERTKAAGMRRMSYRGALPKDQRPSFLFGFNGGLVHGHNGLPQCPGDQDGTRRQPQGRAAVAEAVLKRPDPHAATMLAGPHVGSHEFAAEMGELYSMALFRDLPVARFMDDRLVDNLKAIDAPCLPLEIERELDKTKHKAPIRAAELDCFKWFQGEVNRLDIQPEEDVYHRRFFKRAHICRVFRGPGQDGDANHYSWDTPFLSQFLLMGTGSFGNDPVERLRTRATGRIQHGDRTIDQKVRIARPGRDHMVRWADWLDVQNSGAAGAVGPDAYVGEERRFICRLRDLVTLFGDHDDRVRQPFANAALIMLSERYAFDPGLAGIRGRRNGETEVPFGERQLPGLLAEVSERALKTVRRHAYPVQKRLRPAAAAALFHTVLTQYHPQRDLDPPLNGRPFARDDGSAEAAMRALLDERIAPFLGPYRDGKSLDPEIEMAAILDEVRAHNSKVGGDDTWLLPMALPKVPSMRQAAGHATVAGACVTLLKAFFDMCDSNDRSEPAFLVRRGECALVPSPGKDAFDTEPDLLCVEMGLGLTLEGELNKLMWNVAGALNIAGVHYYSDTIEYTMLGEAIAIGFLRDWILCQNNGKEGNVSLTVPLLITRILPQCLVNGPDGSPGPIACDKFVSGVRINSDGTLEAVRETPGRNSMFVILDDPQPVLAPESWAIH